METQIRIDMTGTTTNRDFLAHAQRLGLLDAQEVEEVRRVMRESSQPAGKCAARLGLLTIGDIDRVMHSIKRQWKTGGGTPRLENVAGYRIIDELGRGGMGTVYSAEQMALSRQVALKILAPRFVEDEDFVARFMREARSLGRINHPNVVACYDVGRDGDTLYMVQELVEGGDVGALMARHGGRLDEPRSLEIVRDCLDALIAIQAAGLIHRDIKPTNIFITREGRAKLGDLGLARTVAYDDRISQSGEVYGTPAYMSPEHAQGEEDLDIRTDIYSLIASLFCMVTGKQPYEGRSSWDVVAKVLHDPMPDPAAVVPGLSRGMRALIQRGMAKDRELRYPDPEAIRRDVVSVLDTGTVAEADTLKQLDHGDVLGLRWHGSSAVLHPSGAVGQNDRLLWDRALDDLLAADPTALVVNCTSVDWISSEGLATFIRLHECCGERGIFFAVCALNESTDQAVRCVYLDRVLQIFPDLCQALAAAETPAH